MKEIIVKNGKELRCGYTTGSCAAAAVKAGAIMLLGDEEIETVAIKTPKGVSLYLQIENIVKQKDWVNCAVTKDAGDDPDATNGIKINARVEKAQQGIHIDGGLGVGRVTQKGLACAVGEAAINPVPRKMIEDALLEVAQKYKYKGGFSMVISAENGEEIAKKTFNPRLGIVGGISILGTSGIVEPMSEKALIDTIRLEIDSKTINQNNNLLISPGNYGREFALKEFGLDLDFGIKCSNFIGETIDYAAYKKVKNILLIGHAGKLCKIAGGIMNTHSRMADCRCEIFAAHAALAGASSKQIEKIMNSVTTDEISVLLQEFDIAKQVYKSILSKISYHLNYRAANNCIIEIIMFTNNCGGFYETAGAQSLIDSLLKLRT